MFIYGDKIECVNKLRPIKLSVFSVPHVKQTYSRIVMVVISDIENILRKTAQENTLRPDPTEIVVFVVFNTCNNNSTHLHPMTHIAHERKYTLKYPLTRISLNIY